MFNLIRVSLRLKELIHAKSVSLGSSFHILTTRLRKKYFRTSVKQRVKTVCVDDP